MKLPKTFTSKRSKYEKSQGLYIGKDLKEYVYLCDLLTENNIELKFCENGLAALNHIHQKNFTPSIIFCENAISGINPFDLKNAIDSCFNFVSPIFILYVSKVDAQLIQKSRESKIDDVIVNNVQQEYLTSRITFLLNNKRALKKIYFSKKTEDYKLPLSKRIFDISISILALLFLLPLFIVIALLIKIDSKGPVFYASKRVGKNYKVFDFYKFRTMKVGADKEIDQLSSKNQYANTTIEEVECKQCKNLGRPCSSILIRDGLEICENHYIKNKKNTESTFIKISKDPRITRLGSFLRNSSIDELPQLFNILKGDMSIVGNRPLPLYEAEQLTSDQWATRFLGPAGLTGLWQVSKRGGSKMSADERKELDNVYTNKFSFWFDIKIILKTIPALIQKENV